MTYTCRYNDVGEFSSIMRRFPAPIRGGENDDDDEDDDDDDDLRLSTQKLAHFQENYRRFSYASK